MKVTFNNGFYEVQRTTGPRHNFLALKFDDDNSEIEAIQLPPIGECQHEKLNVALIVEHVVEAIEDINQQQGITLKVAIIKFVSNDTPPETAYYTLARKIALHVAVNKF